MDKKNNFGLFCKEKIINIYFSSLEKAIRNQKLYELKNKLEQIVPDITNQYSLFDINTPYLNTKVRGCHAFQISLVDKVINKFDKPVIVDIGDSSGTHLQYINALYNSKNKIKCLSVNLDKKAVDKIKSKNLEAVYARAEELDQYNINADIFLCFETLEHFMNPCFFLHELSSKTKAEYLIVTVPYLSKSRVGLHHIRNKRNENIVYAENTHIFEFCPEDWKLVVKHSGWDIVEEKIYLQYPKNGFWRISKFLWKKFDFEGFYGLILKRDAAWADKYADW